MSHSTSTHTQKVLPKASDHHTAGRTHACWHAHTCNSHKCIQGAQTHRHWRHGGPFRDLTHAGTTNMSRHWDTQMMRKMLGTRFQSPL